MDSSWRLRLHLRIIPIWRYWCRLFRAHSVRKARKSRVENTLYSRTRMLCIPCVISGYSHSFGGLSRNPRISDKPGESLCLNLARQQFPGRQISICIPHTKQFYHGTDSMPEAKNVIAMILRRKRKQSAVKGTVWSAPHFLTKKKHWQNHILAFKYILFWKHCLFSRQL